MSAYLDYAATSAIRPRAVVEAVTRFLEGVGATPGRGGHSRAVEAGRLALRCRRALQAVLGLPGDPGRVAFMANATVGLNTALAGVLRPGDVLVVTAYDHNSVLRPAAHLARTRGVEVRMVPGARDGSLDLALLDDALRDARLLVVNSASNVLGNRLPLEEMARRAHAAGALVLVDTAQGAGAFPLDCGAAGADLVAFTGHKGLLGPQGIGGLWVRDGIEVVPLVFGGTGGDSRRREMPRAMPDRLEAGTLNAPGLAGLNAGIETLLELGVEAVHRREMRLKEELRRGLGQIPGVRVLSPASPDGAPIVTVVVDGMKPGTVAERLDREWGVQTRPGLHCAPESHRILGTLEGGALRFSLGWASTDDDVRLAVEGMEAVVAASPTRSG